MNIIDVLLGEHGAMYPQFDFLEQTLGEVGTISEIKAQAELLAAAVQSHSTIEDDLLFAALEGPLGVGSPALVGMRMMHEDIDRGFEELRRAEDVAVARDGLLGVIGLARQHFLGEEESLFPTAHRVLNRDALDRLGAMWAERRGMGPEEPDRELGGTSHGRQAGERRTP
jgi:hemerythrin-like domain-containing protein